MRSNLLRRFVLSTLAIAGLAGAASATWSIILVNPATGEVAIGCATCLTNFDLELYVPVIEVGIGGACSQSVIDSTGSVRRAIWDGLLVGDSPTVILNRIKSWDTSFADRQIGIVDMLDRARSYTGRNCGSWAGGVKGQSGTIMYAIQGNVLTGKAVVDQAEQAVINTSGDLAEKLMIAMEAAADMGGDGRCSCSPSAPDSCGAPPPGFDRSQGDKSAHCAFMMIARIGDVDGDCTRAYGCSTGTYYLNLNIAYQTATDPDPVTQLRTNFDAWRKAAMGRPDHILSTKTVTPSSVPGNSTSTASLDFKAIDWQGLSVGHGGAKVTVKHAGGSAGLAKIGTPVDHGDGTYSVPLTSGAGQGQDLFEIVLDDGVSPVTLFPYPTLDLTDTLLTDVSSISAATGGTVNFSLVGPAQAPPPDYLLLASASGTSPGIVVGAVTVPLNFDGALVLSYLLRDSKYLVNTDATLLPDGTQAASFVASPGDLTPLIGYDLAFAYFTYGPATFASNPARLTVQN